MPSSVPTACTEPVALDPMARWLRENITTTVIIDRITVASTALLAYTALVALVLMGRQSSEDPINLTDEETEALLRELNEIVENDRLQFSPRIRALRGNRNKIRPEPKADSPPPPIRHYEPPRKGRYGAGKTGCPQHFNLNLSRILHT